MLRLSFTFFLLVLFAAAVFRLLSSMLGGIIDERGAFYSVGILLAILTFLISEELKARQSRKQHTIKILFESRLSPEFRDNLEQRRKHFREGEQIDLAFYQACRDGTGDGDEVAILDRQRSAYAVQFLLNYYEFIALGIAREDLDRPMLKRSIRGLMCALVLDMKPIIDDAQTRNPRAWINLSRLYNDWRPEADPRIGHGNYHGPWQNFRERLADRINPK